MTEEKAMEAVGTSLAALAGIGAFLAAWIYCTVQYGLLFGFGFGWVPAVLLAVIVAVLTRLLWPLAAIGGVLLALLALPEMLR